MSSVFPTELDYQKVIQDGTATVDVRIGERRYPIVVRPGCLSEIGETIARVCCGSKPEGRAAAIISNPKIASIYGDKVQQSLTSAGFKCLPIISIPAGERYKTLATVERVYKQLYDGKVDRRGIIVALGGGVVGDLAGFVASSYLRGLDFVQVPTTLLSQVDSSVGGKVGVNYLQAKNSIGAFYQPKLVMIDQTTLNSLPRRELLSGMAEVLKYGFIADAPFLAKLKEHLNEASLVKSGIMALAIARSCEIKARVVEQDEHETTGLRATLNFGHTIGHALEAVTNYKRYTHGEAIAIGMMSACLIGEKLGVNDQAVTAEIVSSLQSAGFKLAIDQDLDIDQILALLTHDKKSVGGEARFVLLDRIGHATVGHVAPLKLVADALREQSASPRTVK